MNLLDRFREDLSGNVLAALIVAIGLITAAVCVANEFTSEATVFAPLSVSDVTINSRVDGVAGPAVRTGEHYNGTLEICNADAEEQTITFIIQFERLFGDVHFVSAAGAPVQFPKAPGCETLTGDSASLPPAVTPGRWRESTAAVVQRGEQKQTVSFVSEAFEVIPMTDDHDLLVRLDEKVGTLEKIVSKVSNGKQVDLIVKAAVVVLGALELQARTGIEIGTVQEAPTAIVNSAMSLVRLIGG